MSAPSPSPRKPGSAPEHEGAERAAVSLQRTIDVLSRLSQVEDFVPEVLRIVAVAFGARSCGLYEHANGTIWLRYWCHEGRVLGPDELPNVDPENLGVIVRMARGFTVPRSHLGADPFARQEPALVEHRRGGGDVELQRFAVGMGWDRELNVPLNVEGRTVGGLVIYRSESEEFDARDVALGAALGKQLALAIQVSKLVKRERERAQADEAARAAEARAQLMDHAVAAMRRCSDALLNVDEPRGAIVAALHASAEVLRSLGVIEIGLVELSLPARTVRCNLLIRDGELQDIAGSALDRDWPIDVDPMAAVWRRAAQGAPFVWGLTSDTSILVSEARAFHEAIGTRAIGYVPLERAGEPMGWIAMSFREPVPPSEHQVSLVRALSTHVLLAIELERIAKQSRDVALAKEREAAAERQVAELAKVNAVLRSSVDALAAAASLEDVHAVFLREAMRVTDADAGAVLLRTAGTSEFYPIAIHNDGQMLLGAAVRESLLAREIRDVSRADALGHFGKLCEGRALWRPIDAAFAADLPVVGALHLAAGRKELWDVPFAVGGVVVGYLSLVFSFESPLSAVVDEAVTVLATQVGLALETKRLSELARDAAVAREREAVANTRAAELANANHAMRATVASLTERPDLDFFLGRVLVAITQHLGAVGADLWLRAQADDEMYCHTAYIDGTATREPVGSPSLPRSFPFDAVDPEGPLPGDHRFDVEFRDIAHRLDGEGFGFYASRGIRAVLRVPVAVGAHVIGHFAIWKRDAEPFAHAQDGVVVTLAQQAALAIHMERLAVEAHQVGLVRERQAAAEDRVAALARTNAALTGSLTKIANEPVSRAPELLLVEVARAADAAVCYWFEHDAASATLEVALRVEAGRLLERPARDEPEIFRAPFPTDVTPAFEILRSQEAFTTICSRSANPLMWPGTLAWHQRNGREEALAFALRVGDETLGLVGMAFTRSGAMDDKPKQHLVRALANQFALALKLSRLAKAAERAAVERTRSAEIETANHVMRTAVDRLAKEPELHSFLGFLLCEIAAQLDSDTAAITPFSEAEQVFRAGVTLHQGQVTPLGPLRAEVRRSDARFLDRLERAEGFALFDIEQDAELFWPGAVEYLGRYGKRYSLSFAIRVDGRLYGQVSLAYADRPAPSAQQTALVQALCTQAALAIQFTRLAEESRIAETASAIAAERNRMAGEIHDSLAQSFTSIALQSESIISDLDEHSPLRATLELIEETARLGLAEARSSVLALRPIGDAVGDLQHALEQLAERCNVAGSVTCEFRTCTHPCALSADVRDAVLRVAQEAVNNALRHSGARGLVIEFDVIDGQATLTVTDDGIGVPALASQRRGGFGIAGMRARAESLGGTVTLSAAPDSRGTTVRMRAPCDATQQGSS